MTDPTSSGLPSPKPMPNSNRSRSQPGQDPSLKEEVSSALPDQAAETLPPLSGRQQPISPPSEPMQFRAIGLVQGKYQPSEERFNRGTLEVEDGTQIDAVLLGQVMSLVKKYIDLSRSYSWVVYPRTREKEQTLHLQVVGVWSADGFTPITGAEEPATDPQQKNTQPEIEADTEQASAKQSGSDQLVEDGYFSIRGQIVYQANDKQLLYVKIQQTPRNAAKGRNSGRGDRDKSFKLKIIGTLSQKAIGYFWDLNVKRQGNDLVLQNGTSIALMPVQKNKRPQQGRPSRPFSKVPTPNSARPNRPFRPPEPKPQSERAARPTPKPIKRQSKSSD
jgi:hypothetical protein